MMFLDSKYSIAVGVYKKCKWLGLVWLLLINMLKILVKVYMLP